MKCRCLIWVLCPSWRQRGATDALVRLETAMWLVTCWAGELEGTVSTRRLPGLGIIQGQAQKRERSEGHFYSVRS